MSSSRRAVGPGQVGGGGDLGEGHRAVAERREHVEPARERLDEVRAGAASRHYSASPEPGSPKIVPRASRVESDL